MVAGILAAVAPILSACSVAQPSSPPGGGEEAGFVILGEDRAPEGCRLDDVGRLVVDFTRAVSDGEFSVDQFFAPPGQFRWFSVDGPGSGPADSWDRESIAPYLKSRAAQEERLALEAVNAAYEPGRDIVNVSFTLKREARDLAGPLPVLGKGAIDCASGRIMTWSMGPADPAVKIVGPCAHEAAAGQTSGQAVVCSRPSVS